MLHHRFEERRQVVPADLRFRRDPALPPHPVEKRRVELVVAGLQVHQQFQHFVVDLLGARVGAVDLVDHDHRRQTERQRLARDEPRLRHRSLGGIDQQEHAVDHAQNALDLAAEVRVPGRVDDIDLGPPPRHGSVLREDRDAPFALQRIGIEDPLAHLLAFAKYSRLPEHLVDQRGLAMVHVRDDRDVAQPHGIAGVIGLHDLPGQPSRYRLPAVSTRVNVYVPICSFENGLIPLRLLIGCLGDESALGER